MDLLDYLRMLMRRWLWVVVPTLLGLGLGTAYVAYTPPTYRATAQAFVGGTIVDRAPNNGAVLASSQYVLARMPTYVSLVDSPQVLAPVIKELGLTVTPQSLALDVNATQPARTVLLSVSANASTSDSAAAIANAVARSLDAYIERIETPAGSTRSTITVSITRSATPPPAPDSPSRVLGLGLGLMVGLGLGLVLASLRDQARPPAPRVLGPDGRPESRRARRRREQAAEHRSSDAPPVPAPADQPPVVVAQEEPVVVAEGTDGPPGESPHDAASERPEGSDDASPGPREHDERLLGVSVAPEAPAGR